MNLLRYVYAALAALFLASGAQAVVIANPAGIVDNGTYITDNNTGLQWYKFRTDGGAGVHIDPNSTVGKRFSDVIIPTSVFVQAGWRAATFSEVSTLWSAFGWTGSYHLAGINPTADENLTLVVGNYLGFTYGMDFAGVAGGSYLRVVSGIALDPSGWIGIVQGTLLSSDSSRDYVQKQIDISSVNYSDRTVGTYLVRDVSNPTALSLLMFAALLPAVSKFAARKAVA
jgi:hypothetical protein